MIISTEVSKGLVWCDISQQRFLKHLWHVQLRSSPRHCVMRLSVGTWRGEVVSGHLAHPDSLPDCGRDAMQDATANERIDQWRKKNDLPESLA